MLKALKRNKFYFDKGKSEAHFNVGDQVYVKNYVLSDASRKFSAKLAPKFTGPHSVSKVISRNIVEVVKENGQAMGKWHCKDLKKLP